MGFGAPEDFLQEGAIEEEVAEPLPSIEGIEVVPDDFEIDEEEVEDEDAPDPESKFFDNLAEKMSEEDRNRIAEESAAGFDIDVTSLIEMRETEKEYGKIINLSYEKKTDPWPGSANVMIPMILKAIVNFANRSSLNLFATEKIVKGDASINTDRIGRRAKRVARFMNIQLANIMKGFRDGFDKTLFQLPRDGYAFRKQYWDAEKKIDVSDYILPEDFVVNYFTKSLESSYRYTQILHLNENQIKLKMEAGVYVEYDDLEPQAKLRLTRILRT